MDKLKNLNAASEYIENNLQSDIRIDDLCRITAMNEYDFTNLFRSLTSITLKDYIRKRRLSAAADEIQNTDKKIIDIALSYGYNSADSFRRAFKAQHSITPTDARKKAASFVIYPPVSFKIKVDGAKKMNFKIIFTEDITVYVISRENHCGADTKYRLAQTMWAKDNDFLPQNISDGFDGEWYGIWSNNRYLIARCKKDCITDDLEKYTIPSGRYAVFTTRRSGYAGIELPKLHDMIFNAWLPASEYTLSGNTEIEVYHLNTDKQLRRKNRYYEIWVPVKEKNHCE